MIQTNTNRTKLTARAKLPYTEAVTRITREKANKQQRRKTRYDWTDV